MSVLNQESHQSIHEFLEYLRVEKNMSDHTIRNYGVDLAQFQQYLQDSNKSDLFPEKVEHITIRGFLAEEYNNR